MPDSIQKKDIEREKNILWFFDLALILKAINGGFEIIGAFLVLYVPPALVLRVAEYLTGGEFAQDPDDLVASALVSAAQTFTVHTHYFLAAYLFIHGAIKLVLVISIFMGKKLAYPLFMIALVLFGAYEVFRGTVRHELFLQALAVFDFSLVLLTAHEYRQRYSVEVSLLK
jgi:uncharacterized membrane protein